MLSTLQHGLAVTELLAAAPLSTREVAQATGLPRQTAYRVLATLVAGGWVVRDPQTDRYRLSRRVWSLGVSSFADADLRLRWAPVLRSLAQAAGETALLAVYDHGDVIYVDKADGANPVRAYSEVGGRAPAHCVATGKVLLAHVDASERAAALGAKLAGPTPRSMTDRVVLAAHLSAVAASGYAVNKGEWRAGVGGIAVPVRSATGEVVAAIGFSAPLERLDARWAELLVLLRGAMENEAHPAGR